MMKLVIYILSLMLLFNLTTRAKEKTTLLFGKAENGRLVYSDVRNFT
jgi:hypothetical protein